jgi:large conductance mechanosensitive channel
MSIIQEFKAFAMRGNVMDMAVGIIIGASFGKIVSSFVNDMLMPPLGLLLGNVDFSDLAVQLAEQGADGNPVLWKYGAFIQSTVDFMIIAFAVFMLVKWMNSLTRKRAPDEPPPAPPPEPSEEAKLLSEIRDLLKARG